MSVKKVLLTISAMALIAVIAVAGTLAFLQSKTNKITNTFSASGLLNQDSTFKLDEAIVGKSGIDYVKVTGDNAGRTDTNGQTYANILPGSKLFKDPTITVKGLEQDAYLYVVVDNQLTNTVPFEVSNDWNAINVRNCDNHELTATEKVYVYAPANTETKLTKDDTEADKVIAVYKNETITVDNNFDADAFGSKTLSFKAYLAQAGGFANATEAWNATFGA